MAHPIRIGRNPVTPPPSHGKSFPCEVASGDTAVAFETLATRERLRPPFANLAAPPRPSKKKPVVIKRISAPKPHVMLADQLRETILSGEISEGESLPPERELVTQTGMTRGAVREALRLLAVEGLVQTRHGRLGGNVVTLPGNESMANAITLFVRGRKLPLRTLQETREAVEPALARSTAHAAGDT
jgi:DNA-binding FadR family transcriptional regulator